MVYGMSTDIKKYIKKPWKIYNHYSLLDIH